ncbi:hypothetical protein [Paludisphaera mucosa]|uniref:Uncharacterized protein n=1 Tax=Paludisphaera mucosa TaxID=3030827 RepID=A0ABT6FFI8_9BACT|nr:hypothetical protein [Paludisphaera mucosa]MDG3006333.1 hypothetical protein [Paludisphaera mucosa]
MFYSTYLFLILAAAGLVTWGALQWVCLGWVVRIYRRADGPGSYAWTILGALGCMASIPIFGTAFLLWVNVLWLFLGRN